MWVYLGAILVLIIDQLSKFLVKAWMLQDQAIPIVGNYLVLLSIRNPGAAFGILEGQRWLFITITILVLAVIAVVEKRIPKHRKLVRFSLALLCGGAIGNLLDRVLTGKVVDFIYVQVINFPIFNLADAAISIAVVLLLLDAFFGSQQVKK
ncbi:MAG: signal peptidase [Bacilli bacterium]|nr:signal peptidase [Bacilli bacterium]